MKIKGKIGINHSSTMYQKLISEVVMKIDNKKIILEFTQHKYGHNQEEIDVDARDYFPC